MTSPSESPQPETAAAPALPASVGSEEAGLLARVAVGDRGEPLAALYGRYASRVYGLGMHQLKDTGLAEELVQETFVRLWQGAHRYDPQRASVRTFLMTIARRAAVDLHRRRSARPPAAPAGHDPDLEQVDEASEAGQPVDRLLLGLEVRDALDALSVKHREVLELAYRKDLTQREIAERLDVPLGTVKTRVHYALRALEGELRSRDVLD